MYNYEQLMPSRPSTLLDNPWGARFDSANLLQSSVGSAERAPSLGRRPRVSWVDKRNLMEKVVKVMKSFAESDRADREYYQSLTPHQRLEILLELNSRWPRSGG